MDKATKAIRRSGVRLKSLSSGHGDLQMIISQLGDVRTSFKAFTVAQGQASEDAVKWASTHENRAISETFTHLAELALAWTEVQREFTEKLKDYRSMYELILEGERHVTQARETMVAREQREAKLRKEFKKASKKAPTEEVVILKERLSQAEKAKDLAHLDLVERIGENEAVKMIRVKEGLLKLSAAYCELAQKCLIIFNAHQNVSAQLPDVHDRDLHDVKYTGSEAALKYVLEAKEHVRSYRRNSISNKPPLPDDPPPPYYPSLEDLDDSPKAKQNGYNGHPHHAPNMSNGYNHPSAPRASASTLNNHPLPNGVDAGAAHNRGGPRPQPTAPEISSSTINSPVSNGLPAAHVYPELPQNPPVQYPLPYPVSPNTPASPVHPQTPHITPHFQSVPNLGDGSSFDHGLKYPPLSVHDNSSFNDSSFHPDTSSSSPNLVSRRLSTSSAHANSPPFNPYYDWLPAHANGKSADGNPPQPKSETEKASKPKSKAANGSQPQAKVEDGSQPKSKCVKPFLSKSKSKSQAPPTPDAQKSKANRKQPDADNKSESSKDEKANSEVRSVRPKEGKNPFLDDSTDEEDTARNVSSTGAVKKSTAR